VSAPPSASACSSAKTTTGLYRDLRASQCRKQSAQSDTSPSVGPTYPTDQHAHGRTELDTPPDEVLEPFVCFRGGDCECSPPSQAVQKRTRVTADALLAEKSPEDDGDRLRVEMAARAIMVEDSMN